MAITATPRVVTPTFCEWAIIATADADTDCTLTHNMGMGALVTLIPIQQAVSSLSLWAIQSETANTVTVRKSVAVGSGSASNQLVVRVEQVLAFSRRP